MCVLHKKTENIVIKEITVPASEDIVYNLNMQMALQ